MPKFDSNTELQRHNTGHFGFSAAKIENLGASEYTIVTVLIDKSGSTQPFQKEMEGALKEIIKACKYSPRADNLLIRVCIFDTIFYEVHGFQLLEKINLDDYNDILRGGGTTTLFDSSVNVIEATGNYGKTLLDADFTANGIVFIITDGCDYGSTLTTTSVKDALSKAMSTECLESLLTILIGVNIQNGSVASQLDKFQKESNLNKFVKMEDANPKTLAKLAEFVSKSISSQSQKVGSGQAASLTFQFVAKLI